MRSEGQISSQSRILAEYWTLYPAGYQISGNIPGRISDNTSGMPDIRLSSKLIFYCFTGDSRNRADVNSSLQPGGGTALHLAAERGKQTCLAILLDQPETQVHAQYLEACFLLFFNIV